MSTGFKLNFPNALMFAKKEMILTTIRKTFINSEIEVTGIILFAFLFSVRSTIFAGFSLSLLPFLLSKFDSL